MSEIMRTPRAVYLEITHSCNLRCKYCSFFTSASDVGEDLPTEEWLTFFEELNRCAVTHVTLSGGEPFYRKNLRELITGIIRNKMRFNILTNGLLISDDIAAFLASSKRCDNVQVSIDGSTPKIHESNRGKDNFYKALEGIRLLQKYNIPVTVRVTIHRQNVLDLEKIAKLLLEDIGLPNFSTNSASYMGLCRQNTDQVQLTIDERHLAMETLLKLNQKYNNRISATAGPLAEARDWLSIKKACDENKECISGKGYLTACNGIFRNIAVRADGIIIPCSLLSHIELGRINHDNLQYIWQNHIDLKRLRERNQISLSNFEFCHGCAYITHCTGGCPGLAYNLVNDDNHPSPDSCLKRYLDANGMLPNNELLNGVQYAK